MVDFVYVVKAVTKHLEEDVIGLPRRGCPTAAPGSHHIWDDEDEAYDFMLKAERCFSKAVYPIMYVQPIRV